MITIEKKVEEVRGSKKKREREREREKGLPHRLRDSRARFETQERDR